MKPATLALVVAASALATGCANPERSRDLSNPAVSATTMAQQVCSNCHGMTGTAESPNFPNLAAQTEQCTLEADDRENRQHRGTHGDTGE